MSPAGLPVVAREPEGAVLARKYRQRKRLVWILRIVLAVAIVGGWEVSARNKLTRSSTASHP
jgi:hypothetical protein